MLLVLICSPHYIHIVTMVNCLLTGAKTVVVGELEPTPTTQLAMTMRAVYSGVLLYPRHKKKQRNQTHLDSK